MNWKTGHGLIVAVTLIFLDVSTAQKPVAMRVKAPEFREVDLWINSQPVSLADLRGKVVALHFWTFG